MEEIVKNRKFNYRYFALKRERRRLRNGSGCYDTEKISLEKSRVCLKCGMKFSSNSPYNRLCDRCTSKNSRIEYRAFHASLIHYHVEESK